MGKKKKQKYPKNPLLGGMDRAGLEYGFDLDHLLDRVEHVYESNMDRFEMMYRYGAYYSRNCRKSK